MDNGSAAGAAKAGGVQIEMAETTAVGGGGGATAEAPSPKDEPQEGSPSAAANTADPPQSESFKITTPRDAL